MKIVQSFWTRPIFNGVTKTERFDRLQGGWLNNTSHFMSWALSCLQLKKFYDEVELVTDSLGKQILIDLLGLPYTSVIVSLDEMTGYNLDLWAMGKIAAYRKQTVPFLHVDSDVYVWKPFSESIIKSPLICQNLDCDHVEYKRMLKVIGDESFQVPEVMAKAQKQSLKIMACNAGIMGGSDIDFFQQYTEMAFKLIDDNLDKLNLGYSPTFNIIYEQYLFYHLAKEKSIPVATLFSEIDYGDPPHRYVEFHKCPDRNAYIHMIAGFKKDQALNEKMRLALRMNHPEHYFRILELSSDWSVA